MKDKKYIEKRPVEKYDRNEAIDKKIASFQNRYMSNSKWIKLFLTLYKNIHVIKSCKVNDFINPNVIYITTNLQNIEYEKYIHNECIENILLQNHLDCRDVCYYKEIEYLEFLKCWNDRPIYRLIAPKIIEQNTAIIKEIVTGAGKFEWEENEKYLRILGYK